MAENNKKTMGTMLLAEIGCMLFAAAAIAGICLSGLVKYGIDRMIGLIVFVVLGIAIVFSWIAAVVYTVMTVKQLKGRKLDGKEEIDLKY